MPAISENVSACGARIDQDESPKTRTDRAMTHKDAGGLSTVMDPAASEAPYRNAAHLSEPAWTAAE